MTKITKEHYKEFFVRLILFILTISSYITYRISRNLTFPSIVYIIIWLFFMKEMLFRLFPQKNASAGNQKIFNKNFIQTEQKTIKKDNKSALIVGIVWLLFNVIFVTLYFTKIIDSGIMMIIAMFYAVCDLICILFYCPFQRWFMKNKCCTTCRIYNWDYAMMFTPLIVIPNFYNYSLVFLSLIILLTWEVSYNKQPEKFHEETNEFLKCKNCKELMCKNRLRKMEQSK